MTATLEHAPARPPAPSVARRRQRPYAAYALALVAFGTYLTAALWMRYGIDFSIGDAVARSAEAKYIVLSRDPHAAALGFYWMPIPTVVQVPLVLVLQPFGQAELAGPLSTVLWGTGTVLVLARLARDLGVPTWLGLGLTAAYALNPVTVYYAGNGMGEGALFFFLALMLSGVLTYVRHGHGRALVRVAVGLAGAVLSRYEAVPLLLVIPPLVALADLRRHDRSRAKVTLALAGLPAAWGLLLWVFYMRLIGDSFTAFRASSEATTGAAPGAAEEVFRPDYFAGATGSTAHALAWTGQWLLLLGPALLVLPLLLVLPARRSLGTLALIATTLVVPAVTFELLRRSGTTGEPRYFSAFVVLAAVTAIWCASQLSGRSTLVHLLPASVLIGAMVLGAVTGTRALSDPDWTHYNGEARVYEAAFGGPPVPPDLAGALLPPWRAFTARLDRELPRDARVLADTRYAFPAALLSSRTRSFVMNSDRDYASQVSPTGVQRFDWVIAPDADARDGLVAAFDDGGDVVRRAPEGTWTQVFSTPGAAALWKRVVPSGPAGVPQLGG